MTTKKTKLSCPECGAKYDTNKGMATHRRYAHGVAGSAPSTLSERRRKEGLMKLPPPTPVVVAKDAEPICPECGHASTTFQLLGVHRSKMHGVKGMTHASLSARRKREAYLANYKRDAEGLLICPECGIGYGDTGITAHRKMQHGLSMDAQVAMFKNNNIEAKLEEIAGVAESVASGTPCPQCDFIAKNAWGLRTHMGTQHSTKERKKSLAKSTQVITVAETNGNIHHTEEEAHPAAGGYAIPDQTLALALGRFQGFCQSFSTEFDLPPRLLASRLAELIYHSQVRETPRTRVRVSSL